MAHERTFDGYHSMNFELLDHPADIGFRVRAATLPELFVNSAQALVYLVLDPSRIESQQKFNLAARAGDYEALLVNWLNEVLYFIDSKRLALGSFEISRLDETQVECIARGEPRDAVKHPPKLVVKAVTYHQLKIARTSDGWSADVYVDV
jgi:SHS2 domain-containing protein